MGMAASTICLYAGLVSYVNGQPGSALVLQAADDHIQAIYVITNPAKLAHLPPAPS
jgi:hypothetical protein